MDSAQSKKKLRFDDYLHVRTFWDDRKRAPPHPTAEQNRADQNRGDQPRSTRDLDTRGDDPLNPLPSLADDPLLNYHQQHWHHPAEDGGRREARQYHHHRGIDLPEEGGHLEVVPHYQRHRETHTPEDGGRREARQYHHHRGIDLPEEGGHQEMVPHYQRHRETHTPEEGGRREARQYHHHRGIDFPEGGGRLEVVPRHHRQRGMDYLDEDHRGRRDPLQYHRHLEEEGRKSPTDEELEMIANGYIPFVRDGRPDTTRRFGPPAYLQSDFKNSIPSPRHSNPPPHHLSLTPPPAPHHPLDSQGYGSTVGHEHKPAFRQSGLYPPRLQAPSLERFRSDKVDFSESYHSHQGIHPQFVRTRSQSVEPPQRQYVESQRQYVVESRDVDFVEQSSIAPQRTPFVGRFSINEQPQEQQRHFTPRTIQRFEGPSSPQPSVTYSPLSPPSRVVYQDSPCVESYAPCDSVMTEYQPYSPMLSSSSHQAFSLLPMTHQPVQNSAPADSVMTDYQTYSPLPSTPHQTFSLLPLTHQPVQNSAASEGVITEYQTYSSVPSTTQQTFSTLSAPAAFSAGTEYVYANPPALHFSYSSPTMTHQSSSPTRYSSIFMNGLTQFDLLSAPPVDSTVTVINGDVPALEWESAQSKQLSQTTPTTKPAFQAPISVQQSPVTSRRAVPTCELPPNYLSPGQPMLAITYNPSSSQPQPQPQTLAVTAAKPPLPAKSPKLLISPQPLPTQPLQLKQNQSDPAPSSNGQMVLWQQEILDSPTSDTPLQIEAPPAAAGGGWIIESSECF